MYSSPCSPDSIANSPKLLESLSVQINLLLAKYKAEYVCDFSAFIHWQKKCTFFQQVYEVIRYASFHDCNKSKYFHLTALVYYQELLTESLLVALTFAVIP